MIEVQDLSIRLGSFQLREISLSVQRGAFFILLGPSGAGKSVLLETLAGLYAPDHGRVLLDGEDVTSLPPERRNIAYLPQDLALFPHLGIRNNILFGARVRKVPRGQRDRRLGEVCGMLRIGDLLQRRDIATLSIGERQRVALARALLVEPRVIFLDEPFSSVDGHLTRELQLELRRINRDTGTTFLQVTHDREEAYILGDAIGVLIGGRLRQTGTGDDLYYRPASVDVARFLMNQNIFHGVLRRLPDVADSVELRGEGLTLVARRQTPLTDATSVTFGIRPEEVMVIRSDRPQGPLVKDNQFPGRIVDIYPRGGSHSLIVQLVHGAPRVEVGIPNCAFRDHGLEIGMEIRLSLKKSAVWYLGDEAETSL